MIYSYTDWHDVDEETRTIAMYSGNWGEGSSAGIAQRYVVWGLTFTPEVVASMKK